MRLARCSKFLLHIEFITNSNVDDDVLLLPCSAVTAAPLVPVSEPIKWRFKKDLHFPFSAWQAIRMLLFVVTVSICLCVTGLPVLWLLRWRMAINFPAIVTSARATCRLLSITVIVILLELEFRNHRFSLIVHNYVQSGGWWRWVNGAQRLS